MKGFIVHCANLLNYMHGFPLAVTQCYVRPARVGVVEMRKSADFFYLRSFPSDQNRSLNSPSLRSACFFGDLPGPDCIESAP